MAEFDWTDDTETSQNSTAYGCSFLFLGLIILIGLVGIKVGDNLVNRPEAQIISQLPNFIKVPPYDPKDNSPVINEIKDSSGEEKWYEIKIYSADQKEYIYLANVILKKRLFLNPQFEVKEVVTK